MPSEGRLLLTLHRTVVAVSARMTHRSIVDEADAEQYGFRDVNCLPAVNGGQRRFSTTEDLLGN